MWAILAETQVSCLIMREEECAFPKPPLFVDPLPYVKNHGGSNVGVPHCCQTNFTDDRRSGSFSQQLWPLDYFQ